ncbi:MAG: hypothetical protein IJ728_02170 [Selenomonadaceae bacterium]|nr:hypothetical protein [Selenomonadaceae bacterium]
MIEERKDSFVFGSVKVYFSFCDYVNVTFKDILLENLDRPKKFLPKHFFEYLNSNWEDFNKLWK